MNSHRTRRSALGAALLCVAAVLLSGCMRMTMDMTVAEDDTISGTVVMAYEDSLIEDMGEDPETFWEENGDDITDDLPDGATSEPYHQDGYTGSKLTFSSVSLDEFNGDNAGDDDSLTITREGNTFVVAGSMDLSADSLGMSDSEISDYIDGFDIRISFTFPGTVTEANGSIDGTTVTWEPAYGEVTDFNATANATSGGGMLWVLWVVLGVVVVAGIAVTVVLLVLRGKKKSATAGGYPQGEYPGQAYPAQPGVQPYPGHQPAGPQYPGHAPQQPYPGQPQTYPGQPQQPGQAQPYPGQQPYPGTPQQPGTQPYPEQAPQQPYPGQPGQQPPYPQQPGQPPYPGQPGA